MIMRSVFQHHEHVSYAFLGSRHHLMAGMFRDKDRPFYKFGKHVEIGPIGSRHWIDYIEGSFAATNVRITRTECEELIEVSGGHPNFTQMLAGEVWYLRHGDKNITEPIPTALNGLLAKHSDALGEIWEGCGGKDRRVLKAVAEEGNASVYSAQFVGTYGFGSPSAIRRNVDNLLKKEILLQNPDKRVFIHNPLFRAWLRRGS